MMNGFWCALGACLLAWPAAQAAEIGDVGAQLRERIVADWIDQDTRFGQPVASRPPADTAQDRPVTTTEDAAGGCDGKRTGKCGFHTASQESDPWWQVDLGDVKRLDRVVVFNRTDGNAAPRTRNLSILAATEAGESQFRLVYQHDGTIFYGVQEGRPLVVSLRDQDVRARFVRLQVPGRCSFALDEVEVYAVDEPQRNIALHRPADQKSVGPYSTRKVTAASDRSADVTREPLPVPERFTLTHTMQVLDQAASLAARLRTAANAARLRPLEARLVDLATRLEQCGVQTPDEAARRELYLEARWTARRIAFCNPLFTFDQILFIKRVHPGGLYHMVHQYYGFCAQPGGGLYVLSQPFSDNPQLRDVLAESRVSGGRLNGQRLIGGAFLSPELSSDGRTVLFAYAECGAEGIEWSPRASFHIFRVRLDGTDLVQLTDGPWNEFDPCFLPDGRVAFISERRGGYLRCGGSAPPYDSPTYTLHSMAADGGDVRCLSFHETQEWQPSVTHDGRLVYTRWDYVDRDTNVAHHIWTCLPDGGDPRSFHGNYPVRRESRPWMEMDIRAVPDSPCFVATAAAHHGHAFGSLVLIDPRRPDDNAMSQLERLTPDVPFPEAEGGKENIRRHMVYGTAWPLGEDDYLCVYDAAAVNHGVYWIDRYGNRELLYRDPSIPCLSPIPVQSRPAPGVLPSASNVTPSASPKEAPATVALMNVYDSDFDWPAGSRVTALRIIQVLPKTTAPSNQPRIGIGNQTNARAVLGTVPVEDDGSAYFQMPPGKAFYIQALDAQGLAIQSMRSATYVHPGEHLSCRGCHETKHAAAPVGNLPQALRRGPSVIQPDVDGSNPFNYVRLVQPVLDRHCVDCHRQEKAVDLSGSPAPKFGWSHSYTQLAPKFGFYFDVNNGSILKGVHGGSRTTAGQFGARAARLLEYLDAGHYDVSLPPEDYHRVTLWLDCNSEFYGSYEQTELQAQGAVVMPTLD